MEATDFTPEVYSARLARVRAAAEAAGIDGVIVGPGPQFAYLTGSWMNSHERFTALFVPATGAPRLVAPATDAFELEDTAAAVGVELVGWQDGQDPYALLLGDARPRTLAAGDDLAAVHLLRLQSLAPGSYAPASRVLAEVFSCKEPAEIDWLRQAAHAIDAVHAGVPELLRPGRTERDVAEDLERRILQDHDAVDFIIVGSGPNGANPHHSFSDRALAAGDVVVVDLGGTIGPGYHSDCTRTYVVGGPEAASAQVREAYAVLQRAQSAARHVAAAGVSAEAVDAAARGIIDAAGFGPHFTHRTGHGIGLSLHEEPFIIASNTQLLEPGMAFSIEPGIYLPGQFGMRLEDIVVVRESVDAAGMGIESLNQCPRELR